MYSPIMPHLRELNLDLATVPAFTRYWKSSLGLGSVGFDNIEQMSRECGLDRYFNDHLTYPPPPKPWQPVSMECTIVQELHSSSIEANNCFNIYHVTEICPIPSNILGYAAFPSPQGTVFWPNRPEVRQALHVPADAPEWQFCQPHVFATENGTGMYNTSEHEQNLRRLIERTGNVLIASGTADSAVFPNGTALAIQNLNWNNAQGFETAPEEKFVVPAHKRQGDVSTWASGGERGVFHTERGLTYITLLAGHEVPRYAPTAAFRHLEYLLRRVDLKGDAGPYSLDI